MHSCERASAEELRVPVEYRLQKIRKRCCGDCLWLHKQEHGS
jgi:hypothetical protein